MSPHYEPGAGPRLIKRALVAGVLVMLLSAGAVSAAGFLTVKDLTSEVMRYREGRAAIVIPKHEIDASEAGGPQTLMLLGSDERYGDKKMGIKPLADTIMLVRLDPKSPAITMTSIPRDLLTHIPGVGVTKINYAFRRGGERLTLRTVKKLLSTPDRRLNVNHIVVTSFGKFRRAINQIGCVYVDIDRDYFNDRSGPGGYATIDVNPGYQKMCGDDALDYVRYRHGDNDLVRAARQQDFIRQLKGQSKIRQLLTWEARKEVARMVGRYVDTTEGLNSTKGLLRMLKLMIVMRDKPIQPVKFRSVPAEDNINVETSPSMVAKTMDDFFHPRSAPKRSGEKSGGGKGKKKREAGAASRLRGLESAQREGEDMALLAVKRVKFPFYFPRYKQTGSRFVFDPPRVYSIRDENGRLRRAYRMVLHRAEPNGTLLTGEYYGVQGVAWTEPPILDNPSETRTVNGRKLELFYDGRKLRLVAWRTEKGAYWVSNTLTKSIGERQMIAIAGSLRRLGQ